MTAVTIPDRLREARGVPARAGVSVVIPTRDEEVNLPAALASVAWADQVFVVDSCSTDRTADIAAAAGATVIPFSWKPGMERKKAWALANLRFEHEWVLMLDADERISESLRGEIQAVIEHGETNIAGYYMDREYFFMERSLRCFRPNWNLRLFRRGSAFVEDLGLSNLLGTGDNEIHEHINVRGCTAYLSQPLSHDDFKGIGPWIERHNRYATWEAHLYDRFRKEPVGVSPREFFRLDPFRRKRVLRRIWVRLPFRPFIRFITWYFLRQGFRDGRQGLHFCVLMSWYEHLISLKLRELRASR